MASRRIRARLVEPKRAMPQAEDPAELVRRTIAQSGARGLPKSSLGRIRSALRKLAVPTARTMSKPPPPRVRSRPLFAPDRRRRSKGRDRAYLVLAVFAVIYFMPGWGYLVLALVAAAAGYAILHFMGYERIREAFLARYDKMKEVDPERAEAWRIRAKRVCGFIGRVAGRLPENWTRGLYLPDFEPSPDVPEKMHSEPFERLSPDMSA